MLIGQIDELPRDASRQKVAAKAAAFGVPPDDYTMGSAPTARDGVMAEWEPVPGDAAHELGFVIEVVARPRRSPTPCWRMARTTMLHADFPGRLCKEGNMAFPFRPSDIELGPMYRFSIFHVVALEDPYEMFPIEYETV